MLMGENVMKILLTQDVDNLGYAGDVKEVADGYGRNYLIPQKMAILATPGALNQAETIRKAAEKRRAQEKADAEAIVNQLAGLELMFERRAGETGKLYGSVTSQDIAESIQEKTGIEIDKRKVALPEPIRTLGEQEVVLKLMIDVSTSIKVEVLPLGGILERERMEGAVDLEAEAEGEAPEAEVEVEVEEAPAAEAEPTAEEELSVEEETEEAPAAEEAEEASAEEEAEETEEETV
jgi:large subunit ribosomal protein L9